MNLYHLHKLIRKAAREAENEALDQGIDVTTDEFKSVLSAVKERILENLNVSPEEYNNYLASLKEVGKQRAQKNKEAIIQELLGLDHKVVFKEPTWEDLPDKPVLLDEERVAQLVEEGIGQAIAKLPERDNTKKSLVTISRPTTIKETVVQKEEYDPSFLYTEINRLENKLNLSSELYFTKEEWKSVWQSQLTSSIKESTDILGMPDFRKLALGIGSQIDAIQIQINNISVNLASVSSSSSTAIKSLYTMTAGIPVDFKTSAGLHLLYLDESNTRIGINTNAPSARLHVISTTEQLRIGYDVSNYYSTTVGSTGTVTFDAVGSGSAFSFSDNVGIGITSPTTYAGFKTLAISSTNGGVVDLMTGSTRLLQLYAINGGDSGIGIDSGVASVSITTSSNAGIKLQTNQTLFNVGGITSPTQNSGFYTLALGGQGAAVLDMYFGQTRHDQIYTTATEWGFFSYQNKPFLWSPNQTEAMRLSAAGNLGVGTGATVSAKLHVVKTTEQVRVGYDASNYYSTTVGSTGLTTFDAVGSGAGFVFSDNVGIGGTATQKFQVFAGSNPIFEVLNVNTTRAQANVYGQSANTGATSAYYDNSDSNNAAYAGFGVDNTTNSFGVAGVVIASSKNGTGTQKDLYIGGFSAAWVTWIKVLASTGDVGMGIGTAISPAARLQLIKTTEQLRVGYDTSNYFSTTVSSGGGVTFDAVGSGAAFTFSDTLSVGTVFSTDLTNRGIVLNNNVTSTNWLIYTQAGGAATGSLAFNTGADIFTITRTTGNVSALGGFTGTGYNATGNPGGYAFNQSGKTAALLYQGAGGFDDISLQIGGVDRWTISPTGDLGIGIGAVVPTVKLHILKTTEQLRVGYDTSNYLSATVNSTGSLTLALTGTSPLFTFSQGVILGTVPTTSAGAYDFLTRNTSTGAIEKVTSASVRQSDVLFDHFTDAGNGTTVETDLYSDTLVAAQLANNGEKIEATYGGVFVSSATATRQIKIYFGGTAIFDTGALTLSLSSAWTVYVTLIRVSATVIRYEFSFTTEGAALAAYTAVGELTGLTLANTQVLKITGQAAGVGAATNDIVAKLGYIEWKAAA